MNKVFMIGRLTKDPELRHTQSGMACCQITLAVNRPKQKDKEQETMKITKARKYLLPK